MVAAPGNFNFDDMSTLLASPPPGKTTQLSGRIPTLDGWRGIAILLVLVNHFRVASGPEDWSYYLGQQGVAIFFVLSGYLISSNLLRERETNGKIALPRFYMRRFLRLAPTAICYLLFVKLVMRVRILPALFFYRNYVEGSAFTGQFWSLSIEEQFYLAWPLFLVALRPRVALGVALGGAFSVAAWRFFSTQEMMYTYWWGTARTQYRADALLLGCALAILMRWTRARAIISKIPLIPVLMVLGGCMLYFRLEIPLGESVLIALVLGATSLLQAGHPVRRALEWMPLAWLGRVSYSVYVWQQLPAYISPHRSEHLFAKLAVLSVLVLGNYYLIENPFRNLRLT